ncbi:MAG: POTRA domain-containing protein, partial [Gemmatimonadales bacterium]
MTAQEIEDTRPVIRGITFVGNESIEDRLLRISIRNSQSSSFQRHWYLRWLPFGEKRYLDERQLRTDLLRVQALYYQGGFFEAIVDTIVDRSNGDVRITFMIDEGRP